MGLQPQAGSLHALTIVTVSCTAKNRLPSLTAAVEVTPPDLAVAVKVC